MIGKTISHYKILEKLGGGGMGVVYKAQDLKLDRFVALKFLPHHLSADEEEKKRFIHEAKAASALDHSNICVIHEIDETEDDQIFICMAYYEGETLKKKVAGGQLAVAEAVEIAIQIAQGLAKAHAHGITHRDIKPANVMVTKDGVVKIVDFGLAKLAGQIRLTKTGMTVGTVAYMSPEQARDEEVDHRADIWAWGVVCYEMLTGLLPFKGEYEQAVIYSIFNEEPKPITGLRTGVPMELERIVSKAMAKSAGERYQHSDEMLADLKRLKKELESKEILSRVGISRLPEGKTRKRVFTTVAAVLVLALLVIGYFIFTPKPESEARIPIAVIDFINETGDHELDGLSGLLITDLEQSRRLEVLTRSRMFDLLRQLNMAEVEQINEQAGRALCKAANVNIMAIGTVKKFGELFTVDVKVIDLTRDKHLFAANADGRGKETIPSLIDKIAERTRVDLKESPQKIEASNRKVAEVTTTNLEAYQHYFLGEQLVHKLKWKEAEEEFKKAIAIDSTFGLAYYRLAYTISWQSHNPYVEVQKAVALIDRIPEKERYLVRAESVKAEKFESGKPEEGREAKIAILKEMELLYPNDKEMLYEIGDEAFHLRQLTTAIEYLEKVLAMEPTYERALQHLTLSYQNMQRYEKMLEVAKRYVAVAGSEDSFVLLGEAYAGLGDIEKGLKTLQQARELFPKNYAILSGTANFHAYQGEYDKAETELKAMTEENQPIAAQREGFLALAHFYPYLGKYSEMMKMYDKGIALHRSDKDTNSVARHTAEKAYAMFWGRGNKHEVMVEIQRTLRFSNITSEDYYRYLAALYADIGDFEKAAQVAQRVRYPSSKLSVEAELHFAKGEWEQAVSKYERLTKRISQLQTFTSYRSAQCYFELGEIDRAVAEVGKAQGHYGWYHSFTYPQGFYLLGKIYEKKGDHKFAIENYKKFLDLWKDADADLPDLIEAKARLAKLKGVVVK